MSEKPNLSNENTPPEREHRVMGVGVYAGDRLHPVSGIPWGRRADVLDAARKEWGDEVADKLDRGEQVLIQGDHTRYIPDTIIHLGTTSHFIKEPEAKEPELDYNNEPEIDPTPYLTEDYDFHNEQSAQDYDYEW